MKTTIKRIVNMSDEPMAAVERQETKHITLQVEFCKLGATTKALFITTREAAFLLSESTGVGIEAITA